MTWRLAAPNLRRNNKAGEGARRTGDRANELAATERRSAQRVRLTHRMQARLAGLSRPVTRFVLMPEPATLGDAGRGARLLAGTVLLDGQVFEAPGVAIWDVGRGMPGAATLHACDWLDDLAAVGDARARAAAQDWVGLWIDRFGRGSGPGWTPTLTGRRLLRWITHARFLLRGQELRGADPFMASLGQQTQFLTRSFSDAAPGLPRIEAVCGLICGGLGLTGMDRHLAPATAALAVACRDHIDAKGGIESRNPKELLDILSLLTWTAQALTAARHPLPEALLAAIARVAPTLRALRLADGGLARFHGGGRGQDGMLDAALAASGIKVRPTPGLHMGFGRLTGGRTTLVLDAAPPPQGAASTAAHASTLAFELTSGRRPLIVNCGPGGSFGPEWRRAGRATPSHSTLGIEGYSSSRLGPPGKRAALLVDTPGRVPFEISEIADGWRIEAAHDGWVGTHGLTHARTLDLTHDGRGLAGEDLLAVLDPAAEKRLAQVLESTDGIAFTVRLHLHPEVDASVDLGGGAISLAL